MIQIQSPQKIILSSKKRKKKVTVLLDLDGVLSDWLGAACKLCDIDLNDSKIRKELKKEKGFIDKLADETILWKKIAEEGSDFWVSLELFPWGKKLYKALEKIADKFSILSSPGKSTNVASHACKGKVLWLDNHFNNKENYLFGYNKFICANENAILVDDSQYKLDAFTDAGGHGFLWPDALSILDKDVDVDETIEELLSYIREIKNE